LRFSVVIPCFNQGPFLKECLDSVRAQTLPAAEVIVVDDGSTDPYSIQRIDELCVPPVKLVRQANRGLSGARNAGVDASSGDWILPLDADDQLTPDALSSYAEAIARDPGVDIWYPDIEEFGLVEQINSQTEFDPWRLLWANFMVCSSAIHRRVFEAGVRYDEEMRQGYEDWAFYVHACSERGFRGQRLGRPVFRYRRWGYSMIAATDERRQQVIDRMHQRRPVYGDARRLDALKRTHSPFFAIAAKSDRLAAALSRQSFQDFRVVDESGAVGRDGDLAVFQSAPGAQLLVSFDDDALGAALDADRCLLEKLALRALAQGRALTWLGNGNRVAAVLPLSLFFERRALAGGDGGVAADLERHAAAVHVPVVRLQPDGSIAAPDGSVPVALAPLGWRDRSRDLVLSAARDLSWRAREALGSDLHDRLWQNRLLKRALRVVDKPATGDPQSEDGLRSGPVPRRIPAAEEARLRDIAADAPRFTDEPGPATLLAVPRLDAEHARLRASVKERSPHPLLTVVSAAEDPRGTFSLPELGGPDPAATLARLVSRHGVSTLIIADAREVYEALPQVARLPRRPQVTAFLGASSPLAAEIALGFNNLIDAYVVADTTLSDLLTVRCYVSPSKVRVGGASAIRY